MTAEVLRDELQNNQDLANSFAEALAASDAKAKGMKVLSTPLDNMLKASNFLDNVDSSLFEYLSEQEIAQASRTLDTIIGQAAVIRSKLSAGANHGA